MSVTHRVRKYHSNKIVLKTKTSDALPALTLNMLAAPLISEAFFFVLPPTNSYSNMAVCMHNSPFVTTVNANGFLISNLSLFPKLLRAATVVIILEPSELFSPTYLS